MKNRNNLCAVMMVVIFAGMIHGLVDSALGAEKAGVDSLLLVRFEGEQATILMARGKKRKISENYASIHLFENKGETYRARSYLTKTSQEPATGGRSSSFLNEIAAYKVIGGTVGNATVSPANMPIETHLAAPGFRGLVLLPDREYKAGDTFEAPFEARTGTYSASYEVAAGEKFMERECLRIKRKITMKTHKGQLKLKSWDETILYVPKLKLVVARELHYVMAFRQQKQEMIFNVKAVEVKKLPADETRQRLAEWDKADALNKVVKTSDVDKINEAIKAIDTDSPYTGLAESAKRLCDNMAARKKIVEGLTVHLVPEAGCRYSLYVPMGYEPSKDSTLIVSLHGQGMAEGPMVKMWVPHANQTGTVIVAPKSPQSTWTGNDVKRIIYIIKEVQKVYQISPDRTALFGFSAGGALAYTVHFGVKDRIVNCLVIASGHLGMVQLRKKITSALGKFADKIKDVPMYLVVGEKDPGVNGVRADKKLFEKNGAKVQYVEVPGMGHTFKGELLPPIYEWLSTVFPAIP
jgi:predicted esterase